jgi:UDP-glucose 4-epimerase
MADGVLLLGGNGFIGQALASRFIQKGRCVHIVSRSKPTFAFCGAHHHTGSLDDAVLLDHLLPKCSTIIHLAATCTPGASANNPSREGEENLLPLLRLLEILSAYTPRPFIFISSGGTVYGDPASLPVTEEAPFAPLSYHGANKVAAELFLSVFARQGWPVMFLRPSNIYGPGQPLRASFGVIRTMLEHMRHGTEMEVWGDGETIRDYLYIDDFTEAVSIALEQKIAGTFNVGGGVGHSLNQLIALAETVTGRKLDVSRKPLRSGDVRSIVLDCQHLRETTGWTPAVALEEGLARTWQWVLQQP